MSAGTSLVFSQLFSIGDLVEIPIIQRDYAQGRTSASEVRNQFLATIYDTLNTPHSELERPLGLDFVYGSIVNRGEFKVFQPLDGQQRLTTLFLLHWYLACLDKKKNEFRQLMLNGNTSKFTYQTRASSTDFFDGLVMNMDEFDPTDTDHSNGSTSTALSRNLKNHQWYFLSWNADPTVQSALGMLDAIHARFSDSVGFYDRLTQTKNPYITFQFLNLDDFDLSDDLYIKMNARGKPLTPFENLKAKFEQLIGKICEGETIQLNGTDVLLQDYVNSKLDTDWADLFWHYSDADTEKYDELMMNFFRSVSTALYPLDKDVSERNKVAETLNTLRNKHENLTFLQYQELECFDSTFITNFISTLDALCKGENGVKKYLDDDAYYDEESVFKLSLQETDPRRRSGLNYEKAVQFFAYCAYLTEHPNNISSPALYEWMRVIHNLSENTIYSNRQEFTDSLFSILQMLENADNILEHLSDMENSVKGFYTPQIREERIKAKLILRNEEWKSSIFQAEQHGYFKGEIEFLLEFSGVSEAFLEDANCEWDAVQDKSFHASFKSYYKKSVAIFDSNGLRKFENFLFERALLATGDYLLYTKSNLCFLDSRGEREMVWKRLLKGSERTADTNRVAEKRLLLKSLFDNFDANSPSDSLTSIINDTKIDEEWRRMLVECPKLIDFCGRKCIRVQSEDEIFLMSKMRMNGSHLELRTYYLYHTYILPKKAENKLQPFTWASPESTYTDWEQPHIVLGGAKFGDSRLKLEIYYMNSTYKLQISTSSDQSFPKFLFECLTGDLFFEDLEDKSLRRIVSPDNIKAEMDNILLTLSKILPEEDPAEEIAD